MTETLTPGAVAAGTIEHVDPHTLVIEPNVRLSAPISKEFVESIRQNGVLTPLMARRDEQGNILVRAGQRRTLGSREAGVATVPVYIVDADEATADRIIQQMVENDQRLALSDSDRAAAFQQLAFEGLGVAAIAKRTGTKQGVVKSALAVQDNAVAASAIATHQLTLDQAATLIEFDGDTSTVDQLIEVATKRPDQFAHAAQRARDEARYQQLRATATAEATEAGFAILEHRPGYYDKTPVNVEELRDGDGNRVTLDSLTGLSGISAYITVYASDEVATNYYIDDPKAHGFQKPSTNSNAGPMTDEQKAERKTLIANNKAWASAEIVRREWVTAFLSRKTLPKDAAQVVAYGLTSHRHATGKAISGGNSLAAKLLGLSDAGQWSADTLSPIVTATPTKALHVALAVVLGGIEDNIDRTTWRYPTKAAAAYLNQLSLWGYPLSEVEEIVTAASTSGRADDDADEAADDDADEFGGE